MASLPATQQGDIKKLFSQIETRAKRKKLQESARRYVALKKAVAERLEGSSMCLPPEILGSVVRFVSVKCFTRASVASSGERSARNGRGSAPPPPVRWMKSPAAARSHSLGCHRPVSREWGAET